MSVKLFCPCSEPLDGGSVEESEGLQYPSTIKDSHTFHLPSYLYYCITCQSVKCRKCTEPEVVTKYCPQCMLEVKPAYSFCLRNCLCCPICDSNVLMHHINDSTMKLQLKCSSNCDWKWDVDQSVKKSLSRIVKNELNTKDPKISQFDRLEKFYIQRKQLNDDGVIPKQILLEISHLNLQEQKNKELDILEYLNDKIIMPFREDEDLKKAQTLQEASTNDSISNYKQSMGLIQSDTTFRDTLLPKFRKLRTKCSLRCKSCRTSIVKPDPPAQSTKFYKLQVAISYLPSIRILKKNGIKPDDAPARYFMVLTNPLSSIMEINISFSNPNISLPVTHTKLNPKPEALTIESLLKQTSSLELNKATKFSRVAMLEKIQNLSDEESIYEEGANYAVLPMKVHSVTSADILLFISVQSETVNTGFWINMQL